MIEVRNLVKRYGDHEAVKGLSFTLKSGKIYGLLGPNGAGKSTTMNMITGYISPTAGDILIHGHNITTEPEAAKKCIGYLPEIPPLYLDMTIREYLTTVAELKKVPGKEKAAEVQRTMDQVMITELQNRLIKNLSKGYKQRVGIAQALIGSPEIIILDEPTVGLDPKQILEIREMIKGLKEHHTVILSSHILSEISAVCDEILIINKGQLVAEDSTENLEKQYLGQNHLELVAEGTEEKVRELLASVPEIKNVSVSEESGDPGAIRVQIQTDGSRDIRKNLFYLFAREQAALLEMKSAGMTLEEIFLKLTGRNEEADK